MSVMVIYFSCVHYNEFNRLQQFSGYTAVYVESAGYK